jgi:GNAT superfamily N-acetyltransferase
MSVTTHQATIHDLDAIVPLFDAYRQFYGQAPDLDLAQGFLRERFAHRESWIFLARHANGDAIGFTQLYPLFGSLRCERKYLLNDLFVAPAARRGGIAAALLDAAAQFARADGAASLSLSTAIDNRTAQRLYESLGWTRDTDFCEYSLRV